MKWVIISSFVVSSLLSGSVAAQKTLILSTMEAYPGVFIAENIVREAYSRLGISIEVRRFQSAKALLASSTGEVDGELVRLNLIGDQYPNLIQIPVALASIDSVAFTKEWEFDIEGWESLEGYHVGIMRGAVYAELGTRGIKRTIYEASEQGFIDLTAGRIDLFITTRVNGMNIIKKKGYQDLKVLEPPLISMPVYHYLHVKNQHLVPDLTEMLFNMENEGAIKKIIGDFNLNPKM